MSYGLDLMARATQGDAPALRQKLKGVWPDHDWFPYEEVLIGERDLSPPQPGERLLSIFSRVRLPGAETEPPLAYYRPHLLELDRETLFPGDKDAPTDPDREVTWDGFAEAVTRVMKAGHKDEALFETFYHLMYRHAWALPCTYGDETFYHLMYRHAWALPCTYGEEGVSLFEQWKAVAALAHALGQEWADGPGDKKFTLIGGDIPGIQDFVYTITSKGAAKGLRGRSFFVQLLGDAVVRCILADLKLCSCNVVYNAGGNFTVLGPEKAEAVKAVDGVRRQVNARLVEAIQGDTALVLETMEVSAADLFTTGRFKEIREEFAKQVAQAKNRPLRELAVDKKGWETLFEPKGKGSPLSCAVCRIEVDERNSKPLERTGEVTEGIERPRICYLCDSLGRLAYDIRSEDLYMLVTEKPERLGTEKKAKDGWMDLLARMTGFHYEFSDKQPADEGVVLILNRPAFLKAGAHGFRLLANVTPQTSNDDIQYLRDKAKWEEEDIPKEGDIRSFTLLAHAAATAGAIERVGVLLMDVDGLGRVFSEGVPDLTLPKLSALSGVLDMFFGGYLNMLVRNQSEKDLYVIYAGGDDLFIVGAWHHLPDLAEAIRNGFKAFTGGHPALSLSGGIILEGAKFPLYRAAERAGEAEGQAKGHTRADDRGKDALCFLDTVVGWEDWDLVREQKDEMLWLIGVQDNLQDERRLPRALLQLVQSIHQLYRTGLRDARRRIRAKNWERPPDKKLPLPDPQMFFGRWAWMKVYSLTRLAERGKKQMPDAPTRIKELQKQIMQPATVRYSGLAARWAEYLTRRSEY
jgi:CRISPR-associated protein Csm1